MEVCHQYRIKLEEKEKYNNYVPIKNYKNVEIKEISYQEAKKFIIQYEWLKNIGSAKYCYGMYIDDHLTCVECFTSPVAPKSYVGLLGLKSDKEIIQICRGASTYWAPKWAPSKIISESIKLLAKEKGIKAVIAYADPEAGEIGTIYQASNFFHIGETNPGGAKNYIINGNLYHPRKVHKKFGSRKPEILKKIDPNYSTISIHPKLRYIYILGNRNERKKMIKKIEKLIEKYPKRDNYQKPPIHNMRSYAIRGLQRNSTSVARFSLSAS